MDVKLQQEIDAHDPAVPFRYSTTHKHHTWARTYHSTPQLYITPHNLPELQKAISLARRCRRRIVVVGSGHSPSDLTCTSSWMVNLDHLSKVLEINEEKKAITVEAGIRMHDLNLVGKERGLTMPNLGSIDIQSIAGALATGTHGSSLYHGSLSQSVLSLRICLANGEVVRCSSEENADLFRAALVSLGALGIIVEIEFQMTTTTNIEWVQTLKPLSYVLGNWNTDLWTQAEFTRVWWLPYSKRAIVWRASRTDKPHQEPESNWYGGSVGYHTYHILLWLSNFIPPILPAIERFVFGMQYGFSLESQISGCEEQRTGLLMNCLYSQFVNEWAIPLEKGPEAIERLSAWINGDEETARIPVSSKGTWVHAPIEVRVTDNSKIKTRGYLDHACDNGPTLYLNATLYRPYGNDPPCRHRYYEAFEYLMREMGGRPHWAKNFQNVEREDIEEMYGENLSEWRRVRNEVDPEGVFVGDWHRRNVLVTPQPAVANAEKTPNSYLACEEREDESRSRSRRKDGNLWAGRRAREPSLPAPLFVGRDDKDVPAAIRGMPARKKSSGGSSSGDSFEYLTRSQAESSIMLESASMSMLETEDDEGHEPRVKEGGAMHKVFEKM